MLQKTPELINLTVEEAKAVYDLMDMLSGGSASNVFAWDGTDDPKNPTTSAFAKIYYAAGERIPDSLIRMYDVQT